MEGEQRTSLETRSRNRPFVNEPVLFIIHTRTQFVSQRSIGPSRLSSNFSSSDSNENSSIRLSGQTFRAIEEERKSHAFDDDRRLDEMEHETCVLPLKNTK